MSITWSRNIGNCILRGSKYHHGTYIDRKVRIEAPHKGPSIDPVPTRTLQVRGGLPPQGAFAASTQHHSYNSQYPEGPSTKCLRICFQKPCPERLLETRNLKYWVLRPSGNSRTLLCCRLQNPFKGHVVLQARWIYFWDPPWDLGYYTRLHYVINHIILYYITFCCTMFYYTILYYTRLDYTLLYSNLL